MDRKNILEAAVPAVCEWYRKHRRSLPWRIEPTPYHVWISEIMLQQTRIEAVIPYYHRFLAALPDVKALSEAEDEVLLKLWQGLGYYSRARNLKKAAQIVMERYSGELPDDPSALRSLPGIGDYTAGAIASIAFHRPEPAVDGNVLRVLSRLLADDRDVMNDRTRKDFTKELRDVYPSGEAAALMTEGIMELGETVCLPNGTPLCDSCPLGEICKAHAEGTEERYPTRLIKTKRRAEERTVLLLRFSDRYAIRKRPEKGLLAGMWEFPSLDGRLSEEEVKSSLSSLGMTVCSITSCGESKHIFSHVEWQMKGYLVTVKAPTEDLLWVSGRELHNTYAIPTAFRFYTGQIEMS